MAIVTETTTLKLSMSSMNGNKTVNVKYASDSASLAQATALANALVSNTAIFSDTYTGLREASIVTTTTTPLS